MATVVARPGYGNISPGNVSEGSQVFRMRFGVFMFAFGLVLGVVLFNLGAGPAWRALVAIPFALAGQGISSSVAKTCGIMAARGMREGQEGAEPICSVQERRCVRSLALRSSLLGVVVTGLLTLPFVILE